MALVHCELHCARLKIYRGLPCGSCAGAGLHVLHQLPVLSWQIRSPMCTCLHIHVQSQTKTSVHKSGHRRPQPTNLPMCWMTAHCHSTHLQTVSESPVRCCQQCFLMAPACATRICSTCPVQSYNIRQRHCISSFL
jgi:hypothetical protein